MRDTAKAFILSTAFVLVAVTAILGPAGIGDYILWTAVAAPVTIARTFWSKILTVLLVALTVLFLIALAPEYGLVAGWIPVILLGPSVAIVWLHRTIYDVACRL